MKVRFRSILSWLLSLLMVFTMMPGTALPAFADSTEVTIDSVGDIREFTYGGDGATLTAVPSALFTGNITYTWYERVGDESVQCEGSNTASLTIPGTTSAGVHTYYCTVAGENENAGVSNDFQITVNPKPVTLTWSDTTFTYNGRNQAPEAAIDPESLVGDDTCTVLYTVKKSDDSDATSWKDAGEYKVTAELSNANYVISSSENASKTFVIEPKEVGVSWSVEPVYVYNGRSQAPEATATGVESGDTCTLTVSGGAFVGENLTATVTSLDNSNYKLPESGLTCDFTIYQKDLMMTAMDQTVRSTDDLNPDKEFLQVVGLIPGDRLTQGTVSFDPAWYSSNELHVVGLQAPFVIRNSDGYDVTSRYRVPGATNIHPGKFEIVEDSAPEYAVAGVVYENGGSVGSNGIEDVSVSIVKGDVTCAAGLTNNAGGYNLSVFEPGVYNLVASHPSGLTKTSLIEITDSSSVLYEDIEMPPVGSNSLLDNSCAENFAVAVGRLDEAAKALKGDSNDKVTVQLTVTEFSNAGAMPSEDLDAFMEGYIAILNSGAAADKFLEFLNLALTRIVAGVTSDYGSDNETMLHIWIPYETSGKDISMFRCHNGTVEELTRLVTRPPEDVLDQFDRGTCCFYVGEDGIDLYSDTFSAYAIGVAKSALAPASGGRTSGGLTAGQPAQTPANPVETPVVPEPELTTPATVAGFADVKAGAYYADAVQWAVGKGITNGRSASMFAPEDSCTRGQMVTFLWRAAGCPEPTGAGQLFTDVNPDAYYYKAVLWAAEQGIAKGTGENTFSPDQKVNRAEAITFIWRALGSKIMTGVSSAAEMTGVAAAQQTDAVTTDAAGTTDVAAVQPTGAVTTNAAGTTGTTGVTDTTGATGQTGAAGTTDVAAAQQTDAVTTDAAGTTGTTGATGQTDAAGAVRTAAVTIGTTALSFTDVPEGAYYADAVNWAVSRGITTGTSAAAFSPEAGCTRGQIVTFLYRAYN